MVGRGISEIEAHEQLICADAREYGYLVAERFSEVQHLVLPYIAVHA
jgi:hypothetical protein